MWWSGNKPDLCGLAVWQIKLEESQPHFFAPPKKTLTIPHLNIHKPSGSSAILLHVIMFNESWLQFRKFPTYKSSKNHSSAAKNKTPWKIHSLASSPKPEGSDSDTGCYCWWIRISSWYMLIWRIYRYYYIQGFIYSRWLFGISSMKQYEKESSLCYSCYSYSPYQLVAFFHRKGCQRLKKCQSVQLQPVQQCLEVSGSHSNSHFIGFLQ